MSDKINKLLEIRKEALEGGGQKRVDAQHAKGKLTARERIHFLMDNHQYIKGYYLLMFQPQNVPLNLLLKLNTVSSDCMVYPR